MSQQQMPYTITPSVDAPIKIEYTNDKASVRQWLIGLKRDLLRKVHQIDEILLTLPIDKP